MSRAEWPVTEESMTCDTVPGNPDHCIVAKAHIRGLLDDIDRLSRNLTFWRDKYEMLAQAAPHQVRELAAELEARQASLRG